jgi:multidrug efflux pump subunit AcrA (membrane-fusion protein)
LAVPAKSLISVSAAQGIVHVVTADTFHPRTVTLGYSADGWIEIRDGLKIDDEIIVKGHEVLQAGDRIIKTDPSQIDQTAPVDRATPIAD